MLLLLNSTPIISSPWIVDFPIFVLKKSKKIKFQIIHKKNSGHGDTCRYGYNLIIKKYKYFDYILQIDSDNQCDPKYLIKICQIINKKNYEQVQYFKQTYKF